MQNWEIKVENCRGDQGSNIATIGNRLGNEGWELVTAIPLQVGTLALIFKRPKPE
jgi:hypothetical protein